MTDSRVEAPSASAPEHQAGSQATCPPRGLLETSLYPNVRASCRQKAIP